MIWIRSRKYCKLCFQGLCSDISLSFGCYIYTAANIIQLLIYNIGLSKLKIASDTEDSYYLISYIDSTYLSSRIRKIVRKNLIKLWMVLLSTYKSQKGVDDDPFNALSLSVIVSITFQFNFKVETYEYWSSEKHFISKVDKTINQGIFFIDKTSKTIWF